MRTRVIITFMAWIAGAALMLSLGVSPADTMERILLGPEAISQARAVQAQHENKLMSLPGVQGVGIGARDRQAAILILGGSAKSRV